MAPNRRALLSIDQLDLAGKRVFIRVDFNVPLTASQAVSDDGRIRAALPTIELAIKQGAKVILCSHLGRPKGKDAGLSMEPVGARLSELLHMDVVLADDCVGSGVKKMVQDLQPGKVLLLENVRFYPEEEKNDAGFAQKLAELCDVYVNDAFGTAHRAHASTAGMAEFVKEKAVGLLMKKELDYLGHALSHPVQPLVALLGGSKVSDKIKVLDNLLTRAKTICVGGAMAYTFLRAQDVAVGKSRVEEAHIGTALKIMESARRLGVELLLPVDHVCGSEVSETAQRQVIDGASIPAGLIGLDIGPKTLDRYRQKMLAAGTVFWNGPMGLFEMKPWSEGTFGIAKAMAEANGVTIVGGGDSAAAVTQSGLASKMKHVSTGGGAALEFLELREGEDLPGVAALRV